MLVQQPGAEQPTEARIQSVGNPLTTAAKKRAAEKESSDSAGEVPIFERQESKRRAVAAGSCLRATTTRAAPLGDRPPVEQTNLSDIVPSAELLVTRFIEKPSKSSCGCCSGGSD